MAATKRQGSPSAFTSTYINFMFTNIASASSCLILAAFGSILTNPQTAVPMRSGEFDMQRRGREGVDCADRLTTSLLSLNLPIPLYFRHQGSIHSARGPG